MSSSADEDNDIDLRGSNVSYYKMLLENNYISDLSKVGLYAQQIVELSWAMGSKFGVWETF